MSDPQRSSQEKLFINIASKVGSAFANTLDATITTKKINFNPELKPAIYAIWHGRQFGLGVFDKTERNDLNILISESNDGEIITNICKSLGFSIIRGSHKRNGEKALRQILKTLKQGNNIAYTVDGPRGPIYEVKEGIIKIAQLSKAPIVPLYLDTNWHVEFNSWDKYRVPFLFSTFKGYFGNPIYVSRDVDEEQSEELRKKVEESLFDLQNQ